MIRAIDVSGLPDPVVEAIESLIEEYRRQIRSTGVEQPARPIGWLKGQWEVPESFFEPLPDDLLKAFGDSANE
jgi:hypothetical protein